MDEPTTAALHRQLGAIEENISSHHKALAKLAVDRQKIIQQLKHRTYDPILLLPVEITSRIFMQYASNHGPIVFKPKANHLNGAFVLASICRQWRDIALGLPSIWARLELWELHKRMETPVALCVERALNKLVEVRFEGSLYDVSAQTRWLQLLGPLDAAQHLRALTAKCELRAQQQSGLGPLRGQLASLHKLRLYCLSGRTPNSGQRLTVFDVAPKLEVLELVDLSPKDIALPWSQLTQLVLTCTIKRDENDRRGYGPGWLALLSETPNLESLFVNLTDNPEPYGADEDRPVTRLEKLTSFTLLWPFHNAIDYWTEALELPVLVELTVCVDCEVYEHLPDLITRSGCADTLRFLTLKHDNGPEVETYNTGLRQLLDVLPKLDVLTMVDLPSKQYDVESFFDELLPLKDDGPFTEIGELRVKIKPMVPPQPLSYTMVLEFIEQRMRAKAGSLRRVEVSALKDDMSPEVDKQDLDALEKIKQLAAAPAAESGPEISILELKPVESIGLQLC
uniref:F-box domain-containing protein n=1 Tax=Mycena chlorophos TaxID=658473 RepID=A0ABQ0LDM3_MYCCL|nr:predicted protein [Mycena chlorophos]